MGVDVDVDKDKDKGGEKWVFAKECVRVREVRV